MRTPSAAILRLRGVFGSTQTPGHPRCRPTSVSPTAIQGVDQHLLQEPDVSRDVGQSAGVTPLGRQGQDRVRHQLAGTVEGDVAAPVHIDHLGADGRGIDQDVAPIAVAPSV